MKLTEVTDMKKSLNEAREYAKSLSKDSDMIFYVLDAKHKNSIVLNGFDSEYQRAVIAHRIARGYHIVEAWQNGICTAY